VGRTLLTGKTEFQKRTPFEAAPDVEADTLPPDVNANAPDLDGQDCAAVDAEADAPTAGETVQAAAPLTP
jgi:hypothetical protein